MREEIRTTYIAKDGLEFDDYEECAKYEKSLLPKFNGKMFLANGKVLISSDEAWNTAKILILTCPTDAESFLEHSECCNDGLDYDSMGVYMYDDENNRWNALPNFIADLVIAKYAPSV